MVLLTPSPPLPPSSEITGSFFRGGDFGKSCWVTTGDDVGVTAGLGLSTTPPPPSPREGRITLWANPGELTPLPIEASWYLSGSKGWARGLSTYSLVICGLDRTWPKLSTDVACLLNVSGGGIVLRDVLIPPIIYSGETSLWAEDWKRKKTFMNSLTWLNNSENILHNIYSHIQSVK